MLKNSNPVANNILNSIMLALNNRISNKVLHVQLSARVQSIALRTPRIIKANLDFHLRLLIPIALKIQRITQILSKTLCNNLSIRINRNDMTERIRNHLNLLSPINKPGITAPVRKQRKTIPVINTAFKLQQKS